MINTLSGLYLAGALLVPSVLGAPETRSLFSAVPNTFPDFKACASQESTFSCENTTVIENTCCSPTPGGLVLQTQFWSTYTGLEKKGQKLPKGSWTIHGLWPDNCDGCVTVSAAIHFDGIDARWADRTNSTATCRGNTTQLRRLRNCPMGPLFQHGQALPSRPL